MAKQTVGESAVKGCYLTKVDATSAELDLRYQVPDAASREPTRASLISRLAQRFDHIGGNVPQQRASFSSDYCAGRCAGTITAVTMSPSRTR